MRCVVIVGLLALAADLPWPQQASTLAHGVVVSADGKALAGVHLYGDYWKQCCPAEREDVSTDGAGAFGFAHPTGFIRVRDPKFQPQTIFVGSRTELRIVLGDAAATSESIPACSAAPDSGQVGDRFRFTLPKKTKIKNGSDVDTITHIVMYPHSKEWLRLWSGPLLGGTDADDRLQQDSSIFSERWISGPGAPNIGIDSAGRSNSGHNWRSFGSLVDQAVYADASDAASKYFDAIIDSACLSQGFMISSGAAERSAKH
jgi:hypothetical protein